MFTDGDDTWPFVLGWARKKLPWFLGIVKPVLRGHLWVKEIVAL